MGAFIDAIGITKVFFPCIHAHHTSFPVMIGIPEEGMKAPVFMLGCCNLNRCLPIGTVFSQRRVSKMKLLSVPLSWSVYPVEEQSHSRNKSQPGHQFEI